MMSYTEECQPPIPIGRQKFAYQCENVVFEPISGKITITGFIPREGKEPYPNTEKQKIENYSLEIGRFTQNAIEITFIKKFKDKSEETYLTNVSFSQLVNLLFTGQGANVFFQEAPKNNFAG